MDSSSSPSRRRGGLLPRAIVPPSTLLRGKEIVQTLGPFQHNFYDNLGHSSIPWYFLSRSHKNFTGICWSCVDVHLVPCQLHQLLADWVTSSSSMVSAIRTEQFKIHQMASDWPSVGISICHELAERDQTGLSGGGICLEQVQFHYGWKAREQIPTSNVRNKENKDFQCLIWL